MTRGPRAVVAAGVTAAFLAVGAAPAPACNAPDLSVWPTQAAPGQDVTYSISNTTPGAVVDIAIEGVGPLPETIAHGGTEIGTFTMPARAGSASGINVNAQITHDDIEGGPTVTLTAPVSYEAAAAPAEPPAAQQPAAAPTASQPAGRRTKPRDQHRAGSYPVTRARRPAERAPRVAPRPAARPRAEQAPRAHARPGERTRRPQETSAPRLAAVLGAVVASQASVMPASASRARPASARAPSAGRRPAHARRDATAASAAPRAARRLAEPSAARPATRAAERASPGASDRDRLRLPVAVLLVAAGLILSAGAAAALLRRARGPGTGTPATVTRSPAGGGVPGVADLAVEAELQEIVAEHRAEALLGGEAAASAPRRPERTRGD